MFQRAGGGSGTGLHQQQPAGAAYGGVQAEAPSLNFYAGDAGAGATGHVPPGGGYAGGGGGVKVMQPGPAGAMQPPPGRGGSIPRGGSTGAFMGEGLDDEGPILEELGINLGHIAAKTRSVLHPRKAGVNPEDLVDADLAGPVVFALVLGTLLLLKGKVSFGYIYGCGAVGCGGMYTVLNLMSTRGIDISRTVSVLGYCLLPIVLLAALSVVVDLRGTVGYVLIPVGVLWCTHAAALFFVVQLQLDDQRWLVAYPVMLFYAVFALISVF